MAQKNRWRPPVKAGGDLMAAGGPRSRLEAARTRVVAASRVRNLRAQIRNHRGLCVFLALALIGLIPTRYGGAAAGSANRGTVPPSSCGDSLVITPSLVNNTNNPVRTDNVGGGKAFRGGVPSGATTSFGGRSGSTSLDPFLRYSSVPEGLGNGPSDYSPFYSPVGTVPKMPPTGNRAFAPASPKVVTGRMLSSSEPPADVICPPQTPQPQVPAGRITAAGNASAQPWPGLRPVPLTATPDEMRQILAGAPDNPPSGTGPQSGTARSNRPSAQNLQPMSAEEYRRQVDQLQRDLERVKTSASEFEQSLRADRQSYVSGPTPEAAIPPLASGAALRRILLPPAPLPSPPQFPEPNPPAGQGLSLGSEGMPASQGQLTLQVPGNAALGGGVPRTPGSTLGYLDAAPPDQTAASLPELTLISPRNPPTGARTGAALEPRVPLYAPPAAPAPSVSNEAGPTDRVEAVFTPQTWAAGSGSGRTVGKLSPPPRTEPTVRAFDTPDAILARSRANAGDNAASTPASSAAGDQPRLVIAGAPVQSDSDLASAVQDLGSTVPASPRPVRPADTERAKITVEPAREMAPSKAVAAPTASIPSGGPTAARTMEVQPKSPDPGPASKPARVVLPPDTPFERHLRSARLSMQQGQYARAAESFSLAAACNPKDVRPVLGRSHALFAAGEHLASAVYLAKAIEFDPRSVLRMPERKSDFTESLGGPDIFLQRITELEKRAGAGDAPVLQLLLAYIYQQMDMPQEATAALQIARKGLPSSAAVELLGKAIANGPPG